MTHKNVPLTDPSLGELARALRKTTEVMAHELASPTSDPPPWTEFDWRIARAAAAMHGISAIMHRDSLWQGPESWRGFLEEQHHQSVLRHFQIAGLLKSLDSQSRREGIALMALKGAALHACGLYSPGERPMGDIDLLVDTGDMHATVEILDSCGYETAFTSARHRVFKPRTRRDSRLSAFGEQVDSPIKIEVHTRIAEHLPVNEIDITRSLFARPLQAGVNSYPSMASLMMHLLLHAAGNIRARALRLIQLHDIARLSARLNSEDWDAILSTQYGDGGCWWASMPLKLTAHYYPAAIPPDLFPRFRIGCPWLLARCARRQLLTDVSWSNIRIAAFPGIEWSRTAGEALEFMRSRIWPRPEVRRELKIGTAEIPGVSTVPWYGVSQGSRILRWIFSRPPRVQTLLCVRAALAQKK